MLTKKLFFTVLSFILFFNLRVWPQVSGEQDRSWKYLIERKINIQDTFTNKSEQLIARAFIYYGKDSEKAGGQVKEVPQVVYIDSNDQPLTGTAHSSPPFVPADPNNFGLISNIYNNMGNEPSSPVSADGLPTVFVLLPLKPEGALKKGLSWNRTLYATFGIVRDINDLPIFPVSIEHNVRGYETKMGRNCTIIDYTISGTHQIVDEERRQKGNYNLKGNGTAYYDTLEEIVVEKEQTISWLRSAEANFQMDNEPPNWKPTGEINETVSIKISLQNDNGSGSTGSLETNQSSAEKPLGIVLPIAGVAIAVIVIAGLFIFSRKKKT